MRDITEIRQMADEGEWECVFYILVNDAQKRLALKDEVAKRICQKFMSVAGVSSYCICSGAITRDSTSLRERFNALLPVQAEFILVEPEKGLARLLTPEQRDWFLERLRSYDGDTVQLAAAVLIGDELDPYRGDIAPHCAALRQIHDRLQGLLGEYTATNCFNDVPEGASDPDGLAYALRRLGEIRAEAAPLARCPEVTERLERILDETEFFLRQYEQPGVVTRWRKLNPHIEFFDCAFDILEDEPELFEQIRTGQTSPIDLACYPAPEELEERARYFAAVEQRFVQEGRAYSDDAAFQDELCQTLDLVFSWDFEKSWDEPGA